MTSLPRRYVYVANKAWLLWLMCLIPITALVIFWWLVFTHEKVHCLNRSRVAALLLRHGRDKDARYVRRLRAAADRANCCARRSRGAVAPEPEELPEDEEEPRGEEGL